MLTIIFNSIVVICSIFFFVFGCVFIFKYKSRGVWMFLTMLCLALFGISTINVNSNVKYEEPAAMMVRDGTLVVIDSNKAVHIIIDYENGMVCIEKRIYERLNPLLNDTLVSINTKCQNLLK